VLRAGDHAPDAPCRRAAGQPVRLFTLSGGGGWLLLRYEASGPSAIAARSGLRIVDIGVHVELRDDDGHLRDAYGFRPGDIALIRPDGYVGVLTGDEHGAALAAYLDRHCGGID
jgi:hypothetical protein